MKKILSLILVMILSISILSGCGNKEDKAKDQADADKKQTETEKKDKADNKESKNEDAKEVTVEAPKDLDETLLSVGDYKMTKADANLYLFSSKINVENMGLGPTIWVNEIQKGKTFEQLQLEQLKNTLIYIGVMMEEARKNNITLTDEEKGKANVNELLNSFHPNINTYYGFSEKVLTKFFENQVLVNKAVAHEMKDFKVDQAKLKELYQADQNYQKLMEVGKDHYYDKVRVRHILISTVDKDQKPLPEDKKAEAKKKAEAILARAKAGEDFAELAKANSQDPGSKDKGGEYVFGRGEMVPEFESAAYSLNEGEISDLVETGFGYHIIKLEEKFPSTAEDIKKADEMEKQIIAQYEEQLKAEEFQKRFEKIKANYNVEFNDALYETMSLSYNVPLPQPKKNEEVKKDSQTNDKKESKEDDQEKEKKDSKEDSNKTEKK